MSYEMLPTKEEITSRYEEYFDKTLYSTVFNAALISKFNAKFDFDVLEKLFKKHSDNKDAHHTFLKVYFLNKIYNTQLEKRHNLQLFANKICEKSHEIDSRLCNGEDGVVDTIRWLDNKDNTGIGEYSFATKFCFFHNPDKYVIYDSNVDRALWFYKDALQLKSRQGLTNYPKYKSIIEHFSECINANDIPKRAIEFYLYKKGQELLYKKPKS